MKKILLLTLFISLGIQAQSNQYWSRIDATKSKLATNKACQRELFP